MNPKVPAKSVLEMRALTSEEVDWITNNISGEVKDILFLRLAAEEPERLASLQAERKAHEQYVASDFYRQHSKMLKQEVARENENRSVAGEMLARFQHYLRDATGKVVQMFTIPPLLPDGMAEARMASDPLADKFEDLIIEREEQPDKIVYRFIYAGDNPAVRNALLERSRVVLHTRERSLYSPFARKFGAAVARVEVNRELAKETADGRLQVDIMVKR